MRLDHLVVKNGSIRLGDGDDYRETCNCHHPGNPEGPAPRDRGREARDNGADQGADCGNGHVKGHGIASSRRVVEDICVQTPKNRRRGRGGNTTEQSEDQESCIIGRCRRKKHEQDVAQVCTDQNRFAANVLAERAEEERTENVADHVQRVEEDEVNGIFDVEFLGDDIESTRRHG
ncbi:hypothetical protein HG531_011735 [Fusarium graminearum]|nr:hypothetical protein HG531_011735 [Fusarium graminearum]